MSLVDSVDTEAAAAEARRSSRRADRYAARRQLWRITKLRRVAYCGRVLTDTATGVSVRLSETATGNRAGFSGLQTCGSVWACPVCSEKVNAARQVELETGMGNWMRGGGSVLFGTFTLSHSRGDGLKELWDAVSRSWSKVVAGSAWAGGKKEPGDKAAFGIVGVVRLVEVKHGVNGWHPHVHVLIFLEKPLTPGQVEDLRGRLFGRWSAAVARAGFRSAEFVDGQAIGADLRVVEGTELADYFAKNTYSATTSAGTAAYEVTGSHSKKLGKGGRTPFQILADIVAGDARRVGDGLVIDEHTGEVLDSENDRGRSLALWQEWERVSRGRLQLTWSKGLRDVLTLQEERTDEEIVEDDALAGETVHVIGAAEWKAFGWALRSDEILAAAEAGTLAALFGQVGRSNRLRATEPGSPPG